MTEHAAFGPAPTVRRGRLAWLGPEDLSAEQREVYRAIVSGPRSTGPQVFEMTDAAGRLEGPFNALLVNPKLGKVVQDLGIVVRYASALRDREREIAILELAHQERCDFEWYAHERLGRAIGLEAHELEALLIARECETFSAEEALVRRVVRSLHANRDLDDELFGEAVGVLGYERVADLVVLVGYYQLLSLSLTVWRTPLPGEASGQWGNTPGVEQGVPRSDEPFQ